MKNLGKLVIATIVAVASISCGAFASKPTQVPTATINDQATIVVDQSSIAETNMGAEINSGYLFAAQTFTAQASGVLAGVSLDITASSIGSYPLHVAIRTVDYEGNPGPAVLAETALDSQSAPPTRIISFPQAVAIRAGDRYAIVVDYAGGAEVKGKCLGIWSGATGDPYPGGKPFVSISDGLTWTTGGEADFHFQTFVRLGPMPSGGSVAATNTVGSSKPETASKTHLSVSTRGLTGKRDQLALWSGDNEPQRFCFSDCRDTSDFVQVKPDRITVQEGFPIVYDQWTVFLEIAPASVYPKNSIEIDILFKGVSWSCINDQGEMGPQSDFQIIYVASIDPLNNDPPVASMPPHFSCFRK